jgi:hypothetical protein
MGKRETGPQAVRRSARDACAFLQDTGLVGPVDTDQGVAYLGYGMRVHIYFAAHHKEVSVAVLLAFSTADGRRQTSAHLETLYRMLGMAAPRGLGARAGNARVVALRVHEAAAALEAILPRLLESDRETLVRCVGRGFTEPDLRQVARLGSPRFDDYQDMPFRHRLDDLVDRVVFEYLKGTEGERARMHSVLTPRGAQVLSVWAGRWERAIAGYPHPLEVDMAQVARTLAAGS